MPTALAMAGEGGSCRQGGCAVEVEPDDECRVVAMTPARSPSSTTMTGMSLAMSRNLPAKPSLHHRPIRRRSPEASTAARRRRALRSRRRRHTANRAASSVRRTPARSPCLFGGKRAASIMPSASTAPTCSMTRFMAASRAERAPTGLCHRGEDGGFDDARHRMQPGTARWRARPGPGCRPAPSNVGGTGGRSCGGLSGELDGGGGHVVGVEQVGASGAIGEACGLAPGRRGRRAGGWSGC